MMSLNRKIGMIDGGLFLIFWSIIGMFNANYWYGALPIIIFILIPSSAFVAWRGAKSVTKIKNKKLTCKSSSLEGAICGFIASLILVIWSYSSHAYAAGSVFDDVSPSTIEFYKRLVIACVPIISAGTLLGSIHGVLFFRINMFLIKTIR